MAKQPFFFQAEDGIRDTSVTGVQTCALPIWRDGKLHGRRTLKRSAEMRLLVAAFGDPGHAFPAIALGRELASRGHRVVVETWERWRDATEEVGLEFRAAEQYRVFPPPGPESGDAGAADAAMALAPLLEELEPDLVVSDILTLAPALAAEVAGVPRATLIPHIYPVHEPGLPFFAVGVQPPRTPG